MRSKYSAKGRDGASRGEGEFYCQASELCFKCISGIVLLHCSSDGAVSGHGAKKGEIML